MDFNQKIGIIRAYTHICCTKMYNQCAIGCVTFGWQYMLYIFLVYNNPICCCNSIICIIMFTWLFLLQYIPKVPLLVFQTSPLPIRRVTLFISWLILVLTARHYVISLNILGLVSFSFTLYLVISSCFCNVNCKATGLQFICLQVLLPKKD